VSLFVLLDKGGEGGFIGNGCDFDAVVVLLGECEFIGPGAVREGGAVGDVLK
jgi:hypothetical protein